MGGVCPESGWFRKNHSLQQQIFIGGIYQVKEGGLRYVCLQQQVFVGGIYQCTPIEHILCACNSRYLWVVYTDLTDENAETLACNSRYLWVVYT